MSEKRHPGISMHKLPVGAGFPGLVFTIGCSLIFLLGLPALWYFVVFGAALGIAVAVILRLTNKHRSERANPLSILCANDKVESRPAHEQAEHRNLYHLLPRPHAL